MNSENSKTSEPHVLILKLTDKLEIKHLILLKILNMTDIKEGLLAWFTNFLIKKPQVALLMHMKIMIVLCTWLCKNLLKNYTNQLLKNLKTRTVYSGFKDNIWGADLADMKLISKFNKGFRFSMYLIGVWSK